MRPLNTILILSDEHNRSILGAAGDSWVQTPNLDRLAATGTRFANAYCNSPVCVASRASIATGRYPHDIGAWDSTAPYTGTPESWAHRLHTAGHLTASIGKLHYRARDDDVGFADVQAPMYVHNGTGWLSSLLRVPPEPIAGADLMAGRIGPGETDYTRYDRDITDRVCDWIAAQSKRQQSKPWCLNVGLVAPHFPLIAPKEFYDLYADIDLPDPRQYAPDERPLHPVLDALRVSSNYDMFFDADAVRVARKAYYGLVSFLDHNIGRILRALEAQGIADTTRVIYSSDHGDNVGHRGLWGKSVMYDDAVAVPLIMAGPDVPVGLCVETPVSLVDLFPTLLESTGVTLHEDDGDLPGQSLSQRFVSPDTDRAVFGEYHDWSSITGMFMLRSARWKLVRYPGYPDQLFDMTADPFETRDLADTPQGKEIQAQMRVALSATADIDAINQAAFADQARKIKAFGGADAIRASEEQAYTPAPNTDATGMRSADPYEP